METADRSVPVRLGSALAVRIQGLRTAFSEKEMAVAAFLLDDPKEFISLSISAIAQRCRVSETVIIRLYRKLGYGGFHEFKIDIARSLTEGEEEPLSDLRSGDDLETVKRKVFAVTRQALEDSMPALDSGSLQAARDALIQARRVVVIAFGGSASVAHDLVHKLLKLGMVASLQTDSHMQAMSAAVLSPGDLLLAISHSGNSRDIVEALAMARQRRVTTILITGFQHSPAAKEAQITICTPCRETQFQTDAMTSRIVQLAVIDTLYVAITFANKERAAASVHDTSVAAARKKL